MQKLVNARKRKLVRKTYIFYLGTGKDTQFQGKVVARNIADAAAKARKRNIRWTSWGVICT